MNFTKELDNRFFLTVLFLLCLLFYSQNLGVLSFEFSSDETFYFKSVKEMLANNNILPQGQDRPDRPILFYWLVMISFKIFGVNWFAARFISSFFAALTIVLTYIFARALTNDRRASFLGILILLSSKWFYRFARNCMPEVTLIFFVVLALYAAYKLAKETSLHAKILFTFACGCIALLNPSTLLIVFCILTAYALLTKRLNRLNILLISVVFGFLLSGLYFFTGFGAADRLIFFGETAASAQPALIFLSNLGYYIKKVLIHGTPWCIFLLGAFPLGIHHICSNTEKRQAYLFLFSWFLGYFLLLPLQSDIEHHFMLPVMIPTSMLVSLFLLEEFDRSGFLAKVVDVFRKYFIILAMAIALLEISTVNILIADASSLWLIVYAALYGLIVLTILKSKNLLTAPLIFCFYIMFIFLQLNTLVHIGLSPLASIQKFEKTIKKDLSPHTIIAVGSNSIKTSEVAVFFDRKIEKVGFKAEAHSQKLINLLFVGNKDVYCLMTKGDYQKYVRGRFSDSVRVIQEEEMVKRRLRLDRHFFHSIFKLDRETIRRYLFEKIVLLKK